MVAARVAAVLAVVAVAMWMLVLGGGGDPYRLTLYFESSSQLVKGNEVKVGGVPVGDVTSIDLTEDFRAKVEVEIDGDDEIVPVRRGTVAAIRNDALASVAGRYIALVPGPADRARIPDGGEIGTDDTRSTVDTDQVLATLDRRTRRDVRSVIHRAGGIFEGDAAEHANEAIRALPPAASQGAALTRELARDERALARLTREAGDVAAGLATRRPDLQSMTGDARRAMAAVARRRHALDSSLAQLPPTLRRTNTTLVNLRFTLRRLRPLVGAARPAAGPLADTLTRLRPVARRARPVVGDLRRSVRRPGRANDLTDVFAGVPTLERTAVPAFRSTARLLGDLQPIVTELRPYVPELVGFTRGFTGTTGGYYDANGRYSRISVEASLFSADAAGGLVPLPGLNGLEGLRKGVRRRCPGAASHRLPDGSNPYYEVRGTCDPEDTPR